MEQALVISQSDLIILGGGGGSGVTRKITDYWNQQCIVIQYMLKKVRQYYCVSDEYRYCQGLYILFVCRRKVLPLFIKWERVIYLIHYEFT